MKTYHSDRLGKVTIPEDDGPKVQVNVRLSPATRAKLDWLTLVYGTQTEAIAVAIEHLWNHDRYKPQK